MYPKKVKRFPVKGVCSVTGKKFLIIFRRGDGDEWIAERVIPSEADLDSDRSFSTNITLKGSFHMPTFVCPYCKTDIKFNSRGFLCEVCGYLNCAGSLEQRSEGIYSICGNCGHGSYLGDLIDTLSTGD